MKFIFPQNFDFKNRIFGWLDYSTAIFDVCWGIITYGVLGFFKLRITLRISIFIILVIPVLIFSVLGFYGENILNVFTYIIKYIVRPKVLLYKK